MKRRRGASDSGAAVLRELSRSRAVSLPGPLGHMPSVTTRRSTRVFVPKSAAGGGGGGGGGAANPVSRILRSGKCIVLSESSGKKRVKEGERWLQVFGGGGGGGVSADLRCWRGEGEKVSSVVADGTRETTSPREGAADVRNLPRDLHIGRPPPASVNRKSYGIFYSRRRRKSRSDQEDNNKIGRYGIVFTRNHHRRKRPKLPCESSGCVCGGSGSETSLRALVVEAGISEGEVWSGSGRVAALAVIVESSSSSIASLRFASIFLSILRWMSSKGMPSLRHIAGFLRSGLIAGVFSRHGIFFLPLICCANVFLRNALRSYGLCLITGSRSSSPSISVDSSALAPYFKNLHSSIYLASMFLPSVLSKHWMRLCNYHGAVTLFAELGSDDPSEMDFQGKDLVLSPNPTVKKDALDILLQFRPSMPFLHGSKLRKLKKRRTSSSRQSRNRRPSISDRLAFRPRIHEALKLSSISSSAWKQRKLTSKNSAEWIKESKTALAELKQNIETASCSVNILCTASDRCWREQGAKVVLESLDSGDCYLAVKVGGSLLYSFKPQEKRLPFVVNRHNRAYVWTAEDGWKLEFYDKWDWVVFKELHTECIERKIQVIPEKAIPIPGVHEVFPCQNNNDTPLFVRPDMYIVMADDEIGRAMVGSSCFYDMDSADEEWLAQLNSKCTASGIDGFNNISEEGFESIVFALEKDAYNNPDGLSGKDRALNLCQHLGDERMLAVVFDYWLKKRKQKKSPLSRVFQAPPMKKLHVLHQPFLRKRRSFKRQRSQAGRGKPFLYLQEGARLEALHRVREAEYAARSATEHAVEMRSRAQLCMTNAELAAYKSVMSLSLARALQVAQTCEFPQDAASSILD